jgi:tRNA-splicing ligase RtcB
MSIADQTSYEVIYLKKGKPIKAWVRGVSLEPEARQQLINLASMPFIHKHIAVMPDAHLGKGTTVGSVIPTFKAIIPAAVGVDLGCGMIAVRTSLTAAQLPDNLKPLRSAIETAVPVGFSWWKNDLSSSHPAAKPVDKAWKQLDARFDAILEKHPQVDRGSTLRPRLQLGTLGGGNHFIEVLTDESDNVWLMLHSGSRGVGNRLGTYFIEVARREMTKHFINLPDKDLAYLSEGAQYFDDYLEAVAWAQEYAYLNRQVMIGQVIQSLRGLGRLPEFEAELQVINCHHNYVEKEDHYGESVWVTRKGAVRARKGDWGIIPGSMGTGSFIVQGKGNPESFNSCSHGAGRTMSRSKAKKVISLEQHALDTANIECRKDVGILDESPRAYKPLDAVMKAQEDLVEIVHRLKPLVCVKG